MENAGTILSVTMLVTGFISLIVGSYKSGYTFSPQLLLKRGRTKLEVDRDKIEIFATAIFVSFLAGAVYALVVTSGELVTSLIFGLLNTLFLLYALVYWILLRKKEDGHRQ